MFSNNKERAQKVKNFAYTNKLFVVISLVVVVLLVGNLFSTNNNSSESSIETSQMDQSYELSKEHENAETTAINETDGQELQFQFYWIDLWILLGVGGFCVIMIIRERRKAKEDL